MPQDKSMMRIDEAAEELGVSRMTIYNLIARGIIRKFKKPYGNQRVFVSAEDVENAKIPKEQ